MRWYSCQSASGERAISDHHMERRDRERERARQARSASPSVCWASSHNHDAQLIRQELLPSSQSPTEICSRMTHAPHATQCTHGSTKPPVTSHHSHHHSSAGIVIRRVVDETFITLTQRESECHPRRSHLEQRRNGPLLHSIACWKRSLTVKFPQDRLYLHATQRATVAPIV